MTSDLDNREVSSEKLDRLNLLGSKFDSHDYDLLSNSKAERSKTSLRMHFEAQAEVIRKQIGGLEGARLKLGLSQRKIAQLLLVDPSAWTRWLRDESKAPPHIFRSLQWYLALQEKIPGLTNEYFLGIGLGQAESRKMQSRLVEIEELVFNQNLNSELIEQKNALEFQILQLTQAQKQIRKRELLLFAMNFILFTAFVSAYFFS